jgi:hypothetical protein
VTLAELYSDLPAALLEMECEYFRVADAHFNSDPRSQMTACFMLAIRGASILTSIGKVLQTDTCDAFDILQRAFMETRDLLITFRFDREDVRKRIATWFKDKDKDAWKPQLKMSEDFFNGIGVPDLELARRWGMFSALSHPTFGATSNSVALRGSLFSAAKRQQLAPLLNEKIADYITSGLSLFITTSSDLTGWVPLGCDLSRMPTIIRIRNEAPNIVLPILSRVKAGEVARKPRR